MPGAQIRVRVSLYLVLQEMKVQILLPNAHRPASPALASRPISPTARRLPALPSATASALASSGGQGRRHSMTIMRAGHAQG